MIKISKSPCPQILSDNAATWTKSLLDKIAAEEKPTDTEGSRYRHPDIKASLITETHGKCAYCESKLLHVTYGDIEHIIPKSTTPNLRFCWDNLTLACDVCNTNKGDRFSSGIGFVDPYLHEPADHFMIVGPLVFGNPGNEDAKLTELTLKLNRAELVERRTEKIKYIREMIDVIVGATEPLKSILLDNLMEEILPDKEYSAVAKNFIASCI